MTALVVAIRVLLAVLSVRGVRWAFVLFIALGLAYFPVKAGFKLDPHPCELVFTSRLALLSLTKWAHIVLFGVFFIISFFHFRANHWSDRSALWMAAGLTVAMGALVEVAEGVTGTGNCRARDLLPDGAGGLLGAMAALMGRLIWRKLRCEIAMCI